MKMKMPKKEIIEYIEEAFGTLESDYSYPGDDTDWDKVHTAKDMCIEAVKEADYITDGGRKMTRWDVIEYGGKEECAKAIAYCLVMTTKRGRVTCEDLQDLVKELEPTLVEWLKEEVDVDLYPEE